MHHPYREAPMLPETRSDSTREEIIVYGVLVVIGLIPVLIAWLTGDEYGVEATIGGLMTVLGLWGLTVRVARPRPA